MKRILIVFFSFFLWTSSLSAQSPFYQGKTIRFVPGFPAGVVYDIYARLTAPYLSKHIPGKPDIIVQNMVLDEAKKKGLDIDPTPGDELEALAKEVSSQPQEIIERMKKILEK
jgi:hypothetical protein